MEKLGDEHFRNIAIFTYIVDVEKSYLNGVIIFDSV